MDGEGPDDLPAPDPIPPHNGPRGVAREKSGEPVRPASSAGWLDTPACQPPLTPGLVGGGRRRGMGLCVKTALRPFGMAWRPALTVVRWCARGRRGLGRTAGWLARPGEVSPGTPSYLNALNWCVWPL